MTRCQKLRALLNDRRWHSMGEMLVAGGWRYSSRIHEIARGKDKGTPRAHQTKTVNGCVYYRFV